MFSNSYVENVNNTFYFIVAVSLILLLAITFLMIYFVFKYNRKKGVKAENIHGNTTLEIVWTVIPVILVLGMFYMGWVGYEQLSNPPADAMILKAQAKMWKWEFEYPNGVRTDTLYVPLGKAIRVNITSVDVNHSFYIPAFRFKRDAIPNRVNFVWFKADKLGSFDIACAEYCGLNHSKMYTKLVVIPEQEYTAWLTNQKAQLNAASIIPGK